MLLVQHPVGIRDLPLGSASLGLCCAVAGRPLEGESRGGERDEFFVRGFMVHGFTLKRGGREGGREGGEGMTLPIHSSVAVH